METGLFEIQADHLRERQQARQLLPGSHEIIQALFRRSPESAPAASQNLGNNLDAVPEFGMRAEVPTIEFAHCFLRLANLPNFALDRLSRYEANLWRQAGRILYALETLDRHKPQERSRRFWVGEQKNLE